MADPLEQGMYNYVATALPSSSVLHAVVGNFTAPGDVNLILNKCTRLEIFTLTSHGLSPSLEVPIYGRVTALKLFRVPCESTDRALVLTDKLQFCVLQCCDGEIVTRAAGDASDRAGRPALAGHVAAVDPHGRLIALHLYDSHVKLVPISERGLLGAAFDAKLNELSVLDVCFLDGGKDAPPTVAVLHEDASRNRHVTTYRVTLRDRDLDPGDWSWTSPDPSCSKLLPVAGTGGVVVVGGGVAVYHDATTILAAPVASPAASRAAPRVDRVPEIRATAPVGGVPGCFLIGDEAGGISLVAARSDPATGRVADLAVEPLGVWMPSSALAYLDDGVIYVGSAEGDSAVVRVREVRPDEAAAAAARARGRRHAHAAPVPTSTLDLLDSQPGIGAIVDFCTLPAGPGGRSAVVTCSGRGVAGSLRVVKGGVGFKPLAQAPTPGVRGVWPLGGEDGAEGGDAVGAKPLAPTLLVSLAAETKGVRFDAERKALLELEGGASDEASAEGESADAVMAEAGDAAPAPPPTPSPPSSPLSAFDLSASTLLAAALPGGALLQVTRRGVRAVGSASLSPGAPPAVATWGSLGASGPASAVEAAGAAAESQAVSITAAAADEDVVALVLGGRRVVALRWVPERWAFETIGEKDLEGGVGTLDVRVSATWTEGKVRGAREREPEPDAPAAVAIKSEAEGGDEVEAAEGKKTGAGEGDASPGNEFAGEGAGSPGNRPAGEGNGSVEAKRAGGGKASEGAPRRNRAPPKSPLPALVAAGLWSGGVALLEVPRAAPFPLAPAPGTLPLVAHASLPGSAVPRSLVLARLGSCAYLLAGLGDGAVVSWKVQVSRAQPKGAKARDASPQRDAEPSSASAPPELPLSIDADAAALPIALVESRRVPVGFRPVTLHRVYRPLDGDAEEGAGEPGADGPGRRVAPSRSSLRGLLGSGGRPVRGGGAGPEHSLAVFAGCDRPALIRGEGRKLFFSDLDAGDVAGVAGVVWGGDDEATGADTEGAEGDGASGNGASALAPAPAALPVGVELSPGETLQAAWGPGGLAVGSLEGARRLRVDAIPLGESPRRVAAHLDSNTLAVLCSSWDDPSEPPPPVLRVGVDGGEDAFPDELRDGLRLVDLGSRKTLERWPLLAYEMGWAAMAGRLEVAPDPDGRAGGLDDPDAAVAQAWADVARWEGRAGDAEASGSAAPGAPFDGFSLAPPKPSSSAAPAPPVASAATRSSPAHLEWLEGLPTPPQGWNDGIDAAAAAKLVRDGLRLAEERLGRAGGAGAASDAGSDPSAAAAAASAAFADDDVGAGATGLYAKADGLAQGDSDAGAFSPSSDVPTSRQVFLTPSLLAVATATAAPEDPEPAIGRVMLFAVREQQSRAGRRAGDGGRGRGSAAGASSSSARPRPTKKELRLVAQATVEGGAYSMSLWRGKLLVGVGGWVHVIQVQSNARAVQAWRRSGGVYDDDDEGEGAAAAPQASSGLAGIAYALGCLSRGDGATDWRDLATPLPLKLEIVASVPAGVMTLFLDERNGVVAAGDVMKSAALFALRETPAAARGDAAAAAAAPDADGARAAGRAGQQVVPLRDGASAPAPLAPPPLGASIAMLARDYEPAWLTALAFVGPRTVMTADVGFNLVCLRPVTWPHGDGEEDQADGGEGTRAVAGDAAQGNVALPDYGRELIANVDRNLGGRRRRRRRRRARHEAGEGQEAEEREAAEGEEVEEEEEEVEGEDEEEGGEDDEEDREEEDDAEDGDGAAPAQSARERRLLERVRSAVRSRDDRLDEAAAGRPGAGAGGAPGSRAPLDEEVVTLRRVSEFHLGEMVNRIRPGSLVAHPPDGPSARAPRSLFGTANGAIGVVAALDAPTFRVLERLQAALASLLPGVGGLTHSRWRAFRAASVSTGDEARPSRGFVDGDLVERFLDLPEHLQRMAYERAKALTSRRDPPMPSFLDTIQSVEEMARLH